MDVRLNLDLNFTAGLWHSEEFYMNTYMINCNVVTNTTESEDAQIAVERLRWFSYNVLNNSFFVNQSDVDRQHQLWSNGLNVLALPDHPGDQVIGSMLYTKFNAICDDKIVVTDIQLASALSDGVRYIFAEDDNYSLFETDNWWNDTDIRWFDKSVLKSKKANTVKMQPVVSWHDVDLQWKNDSPTGSGNVVIADFKKDD
jgi:hypothetical protein